jgi:hypothetical protein
MSGQSSARDRGRILRSMLRSRWFWVALIVLLLVVGTLAFNNYLDGFMTVTPGGCPDPC